MGYALSPMLCANNMQYEYGHECISCSSFCSYQFVVVVLIVGDHAAAHVHTTANPYPKGNLPSVECTSDPGWHMWISLPRVPLVRISASHFVQPPVCLILVRVHIIWYICFEKRFRGIFPWDWDQGTRHKTSTARSPPSNLIRHQNGKRIRRQQIRAYVDDSVACAAPTGHHINTDKSHPFHGLTLPSRLGWTYVVFRTN